MDFIVYLFGQKLGIYYSDSKWKLLNEIYYKQIDRGIVCTRLDISVFPYKKRKRK
jgi:hypothetical protein